MDGIFHSGNYKWVTTNIICSFRFLHVSHQRRKENTKGKLRKREVTKEENSECKQTLKKYEKEKYEMLFEKYSVLALQKVRCMSN